MHFATFYTLFFYFSSIQKSSFLTLTLAGVLLSAPVSSGLFFDWLIPESRRGRATVGPLPVAVPDDNGAQRQGSVTRFPQSRFELA